MASKKNAPIPPRPAPQLYLATPLVADPTTLRESLPALLGSADIAAVLLRLEPADERTLIQRIKALAPTIQNAGAALLVDGHFEIVARAGADGANVSDVTAMQEAMPTLKPDRILGVGGLETRHDAMVAGEAEVDYVLFGEPNKNGERPSKEAIFERLQWWAEVFEAPCVGFAATLDEAGLFAESGAEFIMLGDFIWQDVRGPQAALIDASRTITHHYDKAFGEAKVTL